MITAQKEVDGEIKQIKVAAEINFRYPGSEYKTLNQVIDYYSKNRNMNLRKIVEPFAQHISTYTNNGRMLQQAYQNRRRKKK